MPVTDAALHAGLTFALAHRVGPVQRRPWPYGSSAPLEEVAVDGFEPMLFKDLSARERPSRPAFLLDPLREIEAYTTMLDELDAPACYGAFVSADRAWLFLEIVEGVALWQAEGLAPWTATAQWLARMHAAPIPHGEHLLRHDAAHLRRWVQRAIAMDPEGLAAIAAPAARAIELLQAWPVAFLHGELYPSNVLVEDGDDGPRVRPIDWETAGVGPGVLDLAALTCGEWLPSERAAVVDAYRDALPLLPDGFDEALEAARLLVAVQWLGRSREWAPPPAHRHDWAAEARALAARIAR